MIKKDEKTIFGGCFLFFSCHCSQVQVLLISHEGQRLPFGLNESKEFGENTQVVRGKNCGNWQYYVSDRNEYQDLFWLNKICFIDAIIVCVVSSVGYRMMQLGEEVGAVLGIQKQHSCDLFWSTAQAKCLGS